MADSRTKAAGRSHGDGLTIDQPVPVEDCQKLVSGQAKISTKR